MRTASRLLAGESLLLARQGLWDRAVANQACCLRIAAHAASEPPLLSFLVGVGIEMTALRGMEDILRLAGPNARVAGLVARAVLAGRPRLRLRDALSGDLAVYGEWTFRGFRRSEPEVFQLLQMDPEQLTAAVSATGRAPDVRRQGLDPADRRFVADLVDASQAAYLGDMRRAIAVADQPQWQRAVAMAAATAASLPRDDPRRVLRSQVMPDCAMAAKHEAALHAREACLIAGTALLAWRARRGSFPGSGSDPGAPAPTDAFTGRPLSYRREGAGFVVYSVGPTGHFDGGRPGQEPGADEAVFRWP